MNALVVLMAAEDAARAETLERFLAGDMPMQVGEPEKPTATDPNEWMEAPEAVSGMQQMMAMTGGPVG